MPKRSAAPWSPSRPTLARLRAAAAGCQGCDLYRHATQTVFGEGRADARVVMVGEQPGDVEDTQGRPFVGPAGRLLDKCMARAGIARDDVYLTNAVKHFKWVAAGGRRLHTKPGAGEVEACSPWLSWELVAIQPEVIVCLGATAAQALLGRGFKVTEQRGVFVASTLAPHVMATVHPSALLRAPDDATRHREIDRFVQDLEKVARLLAGKAIEQPEVPAARADKDRGTMARHGTD